MRRILTLPVAAIAAGGLWACTDLGQPSITDPGALESHFPTCQLKPIDDAQKKYFAVAADRTTVSSKLKDIQNQGCVGALATLRSWEILRMVERAFYEGRAKSDAQSHGAAVANGLLHCCLTGDAATVQASALSPGGTFGVRGHLPGASPVPVSNTAVVRSRDAVPFLFTSENGTSQQTTAVFAMRPWSPDTWQGVAVGDVTLVHGAPNGTASYNFNEAPSLAFGAGTKVEVITCFTDGDAEGELGLVARMTHNGTVIPLGSDPATTCAALLGSAVAQQTSPLQRLARFAGRLLGPRPLFAALGTLRIPGMTGTASGKSDFAGTEVDPDGSLAIVTHPPSVVNNTSTPITVRVRTQTGGGETEPKNIAGAEVTLAIVGNQGVPGNIVGTFLGCDGNETSTSGASAVSCTQEPDGIATFVFTLVSPGQYVLCATGRDLDEDITFNEDCTGMFHVRP